MLHKDRLNQKENAKGFDAAMARVEERLGDKEPGIIVGGIPTLPSTDTAANPPRPMCFGELAAALAKAQGQMSGASKDSSNPFFKSKYADLHSVWEACRKPLSENGLAVVQLPNRDVLTTVLMHESGEYISSEIPILAKDNSPQALGSAISYARRYALAAIVGVYQVDDDAEAAQSRPISGRSKENTVTATPLQAPLIKHAVIGSNAAKTEDWEPPQTEPKPEKVKIMVKPGGGKPSPAQINRLFAICRDSGWTATDAVAYMKKTWSVAATKDLNLEQLELMCKHIERNPISDAAELQEIPL